MAKHIKISDKAHREAKLSAALQEITLADFIERAIFQAALSKNPKQPRNNRSAK